MLSLQVHTHTHTHTNTHRVKPTGMRVQHTHTHACRCQASNWQRQDSALSFFGPRNVAGFHFLEVRGCRDRQALLKVVITSVQLVTMLPVICHHWFRAIIAFSLFQRRDASQEIGEQ